MNRPDLTTERGLWRKGYGVVIGVDEVGRGAIAGPVVAGACSIYNSKFTIYNKNSNFKLQISNWEKLGIDDSKRLTARKREELAGIIRNWALVGIGIGSVAEINRLGIVKATERAMRKALSALRSNISNKSDVSNQSNKNKTFVLIDAFHVKNIPGAGLSNQKAIIKGDQKVLSIACSSIVAKVYRDGLMQSLSEKFQFKKYKWDENKGYGTREHIAAIRKFGVTRHHRLAFVKGFV